MVLERPSDRDTVLDILERVLDKGIVIDAAVQVSVVGIEILRIDAWVVVASFETYLRHEDLMRRITSGDVMRGRHPEEEVEVIMEPAEPEIESEPEP